MRLLLAGAVAALTAAALATLAPAVLTQRRAGGGGGDPGPPAPGRHPLPRQRSARGAGPGHPRRRAWPRPTWPPASRPSGSSPARPTGRWYQPFDLVSVESACPEVVSSDPGHRGASISGFREDYVAFAGRAAGGGAASRTPRSSSWATASWPRSTEWDDFKGTDLRGKVLALPEQRPVGGPGALRRPAAALLRAVGLQVRDGRAAGSGGGHRPPHHPVGGLRVVGRPELVDR